MANGNAVQLEIAIWSTVLTIVLFVVLLDARAVLLVIGFHQEPRRALHVPIHVAMFSMFFLNGYEEAVKQ